MKNSVRILVLTVAAFASPAFAEDDIEFPAGPPNLIIQRAYPTGTAVVIAPYRRLFPVRIFATPQREPYYNVPPYAVITPY